MIEIIITIEEDNAGKTVGLKLRGKGVATQKEYLVGKHIQQALIKASGTVPRTKARPMEFREYEREITPPSSTKGK